MVMMKTKIKKLKKSLMMVILCVMAVTLLSACGDEKTEAVSVDLQALLDEMKTTDSALPKMSTVTESSENAEATFAILADFDYSKVDKFIYSYSDTGSPEEIAVVHVADKAAVGDLMKSLQAHIDSRLGTFRQYNPDKAAVVEGAVLTYSDKYVLLAITPTSGAMQDIFKKKIG